MAGDGKQILPENFSLLEVNNPFPAHSGNKGSTDQKYPKSNQTERMLLEECFILEILNVDSQYLLFSKIFKAI